MLQRGTSAHPYGCLCRLCGSWGASVPEPVDPALLAESLPSAEHRLQDVLNIPAEPVQAVDNSGSSVRETDQSPALFTRCNPPPSAGWLVKHRQTLPLVLGAQERSLSGRVVASRLLFCAPSHAGPVRPLQFLRRASLAVFPGPISSSLRRPASRRAPHCPGDAPALPQCSSGAGSICLHQLAARGGCTSSRRGAPASRLRVTARTG